MRVRCVVLRSPASPAIVRATAAAVT